MTQETLELAIQAGDNDFSSNARSDILDKYSRFHGKDEFSAWYNSPNLKHTDVFRGIVYEISPYNITCVYKKMFEQYSLYNLRIIDEDCTSEDESDFASMARNRSPTNILLTSSSRHGSNSEPGTPRVPNEHVDMSNSCIYSASSTSSGLTTSKNQSCNPKNICGWKTCERPHSSGVSGYQPFTIEETREYCRRHGKSAGHRKHCPKTFQNSLRRHSHIGICKYDRVSGTHRKSSARTHDDETGNQGSISMTSLSGSPIKVGRRFKHFRRSNSYIDQYREEYTYRKLRDTSDPSQATSIDALICSCGNSACPGSLTSARCIQRWYPNQSHTLKTQNISCEKSSADSVISGVPVPKRVPVPKKRPQHTHSKQTRVPAHVLAPKLDEAQRKGTTWSKEGGSSVPPKVEFFATSLTVNSLNPSMPCKVSQTSSASSPSSPSASVILSGSVVSLGNQHGPICSPAPQVKCRRQLNHNVRGVH